MTVAISSNVYRSHAIEQTEPVVDIPHCGIFTGHHILDSMGSTDTDVGTSQHPHLDLTRQHRVDPFLRPVASSYEMTNAIVVAIKHVHQLLACRGVPPLEPL